MYTVNYLKQKFNCCKLLDLSGQTFRRYGENIVLHYIKCYSTLKLILYIVLHEIFVIFIEASFVTSMVFIGTMIGFPVFGFISDLLKERYFLMILCPLLAASLIVWLYLGGQFSNQSLIIIFFLIGLFTSTSGLVYPIISENNPSYITSTAMGITNIIIMAGTASSQLLFSYMWGSTLKIYALYAIPAVLIISSICAIFMKKQLSTAVCLPLQRFNQALGN